MIAEKERLYVEPYTDGTTRGVAVLSMTGFVLSRPFSVSFTLFPSEIIKPLSISPERASLKSYTNSFLNR